MRHLTRIAVVVSVVVFVSGAVPTQAQMDYHVNFLLGLKQLDENDWAPFEDQDEFGVTATFGREDWPVHIAIDLLGSVDEVDVPGATLEGSTVELGVGVRKIWEHKKTRPFLGGGLAIVNGENSVDVGGASFSVDDDTIGAWIDGGVFWRLGRRFNLGFELRVSRGEVELEGFDVEAGGEHFGVLLGWGSPE